MATPRNSSKDQTYVPDQMTESEISRTAGTVTVPDTFTNEEYGSILSFEDAVRLAEAKFGTIVLAHEEPLLGTGFRIAAEDDKRRLIGVPMLLLDWKFYPGDFGREFVSIHATSHGDVGAKAQKWILNDGGTGIARDLRQYSDKTGRYGALALHHGLRVSDYPTNADTGLPLSITERDALLVAGGKVGKGYTFYLDFSA